ncbi:MAG: rubrerythrin [Lentisphaerae bacterium]|nr:rubrerythrin [Lentisphaerota bacterium]MCP4101830.1 rubrerythrin [Lentisphaerota bacterium]
MPEFCTPFSVLHSDRKLTNGELTRAIRFMIAAEYEAIQLYLQLAESTDNKLAHDVLVDIANEEKVHAGEFIRLLKELNPDEQRFYDEGAHEVDEIIQEIALNKKPAPPPIPPKPPKKGEKPPKPDNEGPPTWSS